MNNLAGVVKFLQNEQDRLTRELRGIRSALTAFGKTYSNGTGTRKLSRSARARIAAAQRARWAKARQDKAEKQKVVRMPKQRLISAAARRRIAAAQRARWAKIKAAQKKSA